jgi:NRPS condensation-like uncharacterized protein
MQFVKLNAFQQIMRLWDRVYPYNAVQAFRVQGPADVERIADAWADTLQSMGVGWIVVRGNEFAHTAPYNGDARAQVQVIPAGSSLNELLSQEMNATINPDLGSPFRAFVLQESAGTHCLGVTYHHWVADSASIRWLLHEWFLRLHDPHGKRPSTRPARIPAEGYWKLFGPDAARWTIDHAILELLRYRTRFCRARKVTPACAPGDDCSVTVSAHEVRAGIVPGLIAQAKQYRATMNDLLLAAVAQAVHRFGATPATRGRDELALGTVCDLRTRSDQQLDDAFGLFLGFTTTMLRPADLKDWPRLLRTVASQNAWHKQTKAPHTSMLRMAVGLAEARFVTPQRWAELYRHRMPIAAGTSNVNMNRDWAAPYHPSPILDYYRVTPTGPLLPLTFSLTTLGNKLNFVITRQNSLIDAQRQQCLAGSITKRLIELAAPGRL